MSDEIIARHKKEVRDLIATVTGLKKQATKKNRKEIMKQCQEKEDELKARHKQELSEDATIEGSNKGENESESDEFSPEKLLAQLELEKTQAPVEIPAVTLHNEPKKKRNRQKERLAKRDASIQQMKDEASKEAELQTDFRALELENMDALFKAGGYTQKEIKADGHCLFASIVDQLKLRHDVDTTIQELRTRAANYMRANPDTFAPFLFDEETMTIRDITEYTEKIENTPMWGGDMEILALAVEYNCPITVVMSGRAPLRMNEEGVAPGLKLAYYKHAFGLGEHYNSLHDQEK
ncbi:hypothetical protein BABINDRAFT_161341 [Babjeviella inositovora NRRL Y-12698]|uniref:OTU domain-containing protein n=1 Tax=Babjeviella inositovora NRRL Y-12698 TaxID=984486 RepID=A0A1E3QRS1_9ASCO|nr:uncharacterized protein BABINDRAFT_161341 [Babjeviella inositovora NRRL Y-12698]ODQ80395.1 hypothetical protein BABINDRAFT_161341 [Babjeviella inositovora NRRL Y-12698]